MRPSVQPQLSGLLSMASTKGLVTSLSVPGMVTRRANSERYPFCSTAGRLHYLVLSFVYMALDQNLGFGKLGWDVQLLQVIAVWFDFLGCM